jgi:hypothetical protein
MADFNDAGKYLFAVAILVLLVTTFVAFGALFMTSFVGSLNTGSADATTTTTFAGVAATPHQLNAPIISVASFKKAQNMVMYYDVATLVINSTTQVNLPIDADAAHDGAAWNNINISITSQATNSTTNITWIAGTCNAANKSIATSTTNTWTGIASTCLSPGNNLVIYLTNNTIAGQAAPNVTNVSVSYFKYVTNSAYTLQTSAGTITPTASGYYKTTYTYGAGGMDYTDAKTTLNQGVTTITQIPSWLGLFVLMFVIFVIFAVVGAIAYVALKMGKGGQ